MRNKKKVDLVMKTKMAILRDHFEALISAAGMEVNDDTLYKIASDPKVFNLCISKDAYVGQFKALVNKYQHQGQY